VKDFSTLVASSNEVKKSMRFKPEGGELAFVLLKEKLYFASILALPNFTKSWNI
jgi:hypothetical protein